jgi:hypothetical protein
MDEKEEKASNLNNLIIKIIKNEHPQTVKRLAELVHEEHLLPRHEIIEHILNLQNQGKLTFKKDTASVPSAFKDYLLSSNSYWYWTIIILALATTIAVFTVQENAYPIVYARYLLGSIFILGLPGYSLIKALFPTKELDNIERTALSIGLSIVLVPLTGLFLNYSPWGIRTTPLTLSMLVLNVAFATAAIIREHQAKLEENQKNVQTHVH